MKQKIISDYNPGDNILITDTKSKYNNTPGIISRLGSAGEVIYIHAKLVGVETIIAFVPRQIKVV